MTKPCSSWFTVYDSRFTNRSSLFTVHDSQREIEGREDRKEGKRERERERERQRETEAQRGEKGDRES